MKTMNPLVLIISSQARNTSTFFKQHRNGIIQHVLLGLIVKGKRIPFATVLKFDPIKKRRHIDDKL